MTKYKITEYHRHTGKFFREAEYEAENAFDLLEQCVCDIEHDYSAEEIQSASDLKMALTHIFDDYTFKVELI